MSGLLTKNSNALKILMTEDLYILAEKKNEKQAASAINTDQALSNIHNRSVSETLKPEVANRIAPTPAQPEKNIVFNYLGENTKHFLILIGESEEMEIHPLKKETLLKIMSAKGMELRDLAVLNINQYPGVSYDDLLQFFSFNKLVLFGIDPQEISLPPHGINQLVQMESVKILYTYRMDEMISDTHKKREFWNIMKDF